MPSIPVVTFEVSGESIDKLSRILNPKQLRMALFQAVKRTTTQGAKIAAKAVQAKTKLPRRYIDDPGHRRSAIRAAVSKGDAPIGRIIIRDVALPLSAFPYTVDRDQGVSIKIQADRAPIRLFHAFPAKVASKSQTEQGVSHVGIFTRKRTASSVAIYKSKRSGIERAAETSDGYAWRLPIQEHLGPSVQKLMSMQEISEPVNSGIGSALKKNINSQLSRFTKGQITDIAKIDELTDALSDA